MDRRTFLIGSLGSCIIRPCAAQSKRILLRESASLSRNISLASIYLTSFQLTSPNTGTFPFTVGLAFGKGDVPGYPNLNLANYQINVTRRWNDGSVKTAIASGQVALSANTPTTVTVTPGASVPTGTNLAVSDVVSALSGTGETSVQCGTYGKVTLSDLLGSAPFRTWFAGPNAIECHYRGTIGAISDQIPVWFYVRLYNTNPKRLWIRVVVENGYIDYDPTNKTYIPTVKIGGTTVYTNGGSSLNHVNMTVWTYEGWIGGDPRVTPRHDTSYLMSTKLVPKYHWNYVSGGKDATLSDPLGGRYIINGTYNGLRTFTYTPMSNGDWSANMGDPGFQIQIGLLPLWDALYLNSNADSRAYACMLANSKALNAYTMGIRHSATSLPYTPADGLSGSGSGGIGTPTLAWELAHHGSGGYLAYLVTGDYFHLLTMQGQCAAAYWCFNRGFHLPGGSDGLHLDFLGGHYQQTRAIAWTTRTMAQLAAVGPAGDPGTTAYAKLLSNNIDSWKSIVDSFAGSGLGYIWDSINYETGNIAPWQQHFWIAVMGYASDMEPFQSMTNLNAVRDWMYRAIVGILGSSGDSIGYCYTQASAYEITVANVYNVNPMNWFQSWGLVSPYGGGWTKSGASCGMSLQTNNGSGSDPAAAYYSMWGHVLPAIAYAVDHGATGAAAVWARLVSASNFSDIAKGSSGGGNFNDVPVWGITPRSYK